MRAGLRQTTTFFWWLPLLVAAIAGLLTYAATASQDDVFRARAELLVPADSPVEPQAYAELARSETVLTDAIRELGLTTTVDGLRDDIRVETTDTLVTIEADAATAGDAQLLATRIGNGVIRNAALLLDAPPPSILGQVSAPREPLGDDSALYTAIAVAAGLALGIVLTGALALRERPVQFPSDVQWLAGLPTIAAIPRAHDANTPALISQPHSPEAAAHRNLQTAVERLRAARHLRTVLVVGVDAQAGASPVALNLALAFAEIGRQVLLIDGDLHSPSVHRLLQLPNQHGLSDARFSNLSPVIHALPESSLRVVTSGVLPPQPSKLLASPRVAALLSELPHTAELAIIDATPLAESGDAALLANACDGILLVVDATRTRAEQLRAAGRTLRATGKPIVGVVLSNARRGTGDASAYDPAPAAQAPQATSVDVSVDVPIDRPARR